MFTTLFMLVYGDYFKMHKEAITPLLTQEPEKVSVRLWLNAVCPETFEWLLQNAPDHWIIYVCSENPPKYPVMRKLFTDPANPITTPWVTWLDDDTNIARDDWFARTKEFVDADPLVVFFGAQYWKKHLAGVEHWIRQATWYNKRPFMQAGPRLKRLDRGAGIAFLRGSYWWLRLPVLRGLDWPDTRLQHNGGDTALSEAIWQAQLPQHAFSYGIADELAPRRGRSERPAGFKHKLINATDGSVASMIGKMEEYERMATQADVSFVKLNDVVLLIGGSADYEDAAWLEPVGEKPAPPEPVEPEKSPVSKTKKVVRPVASKRPKPVEIKQPAIAEKTIRARLLARLRQRRERQAVDRRRVQRRAKADVASRRSKGGR